jgi:glycosyltransferase involved in cell wall biosynthesis
MSPHPEPVEDKPLRVWLVDPSLYTGPYDGALTDGLLQAGVLPRWATRPTRPGDRQEIPAEYVDAFFYRRVDGLTSWPKPLRSLAKGLAHGWGVAQLVWRVWRRPPDAVHMQWVVLPLLDALALWLIKRKCALVFTAHDTVPFNGLHVSLLQNLGFDLPLRMADAVVVHTRTGRRRLIERGVEPSKIVVIPHGPLKLHVPPSSPQATRDPRHTFVLFGELKPYKGIDVLVEAVACLPQAMRDQCRFIVAGREWMDLTTIRQRIGELGLQSSIDLRAQRQTDQQMADLFHEADCFVFPYREIDASGVYFLVKSFGKWIVASRVGIFAEDVADGIDGRLVAPSSVDELCAALVEASERKGAPRQSAADDSWRAIGVSTRQAYERVSRSEPRSSEGRSGGLRRGVAGDERV